MHPDCKGSALLFTRIGLLGILASKLNTLWMKKGHSSPHLQVPSVLRYSITFSKDLNRLLFGLKSNEIISKNILCQFFWKYISVGSLQNISLNFRNTSKITVSPLNQTLSHDNKGRKGLWTQEALDFESNSPVK